MWVAVVATAIIAFLIYKYFLSPSPTYFKKHGIPEIDTSVVLTRLDSLLNRKPTWVADDYAYTKMDKYCGILEMGKPVVLIKDFDLVKKVLIKDFDHFVDRRRIFTTNDGALNYMMFNLQGDEWKGVRSSVSPTLSTGKIKRMMDIFNAVGREWVEVHANLATSNSSGTVTIDVLNSANKYTVQLISMAVFGMNANIIKNPDSEFAKMANRFTDIKFTDILKFMLSMGFPTFFRLLGLSVIDKKAMNFFENILNQALKSRMNGETHRNDFLQILVEAKKGELKAAEANEISDFEKDAQLNGQALPKKQYLTERIMSASCLEFFFAGFASTSNAVSFALYALALYPDVQKRLREEVDKIFKADGTLDYDDVGQLVYMDMVFNEILRKFPAVSRHERICTRDYKDPESGLSVPKDALIGVPLNAIHNDKQFYHNPEGFDPEHFNAENKANRSPYAFTPFGMGPRNCIGVRFALLQSKSALAHMVHNFLIEPTAKTPTPLHGINGGFAIIPPKNLELKLTPITHK